VQKISGGRKTLHVRLFFSFLAALSVQSLVAADFIYIPVESDTAHRGGRDDLLRAYAPVFVTRGGQRENEIGSPEVRFERGCERFLVDPEAPAIFAEVRSDIISATPVFQLVYRVHFTNQPVPFYEMHRNPGVMAIVTLRARNRAPVLFTTVHTCGCFLALLPTDLFPPAALPPAWPDGEKRVSGKALPAIVPHPVAGRSRLIVSLADKTHRVEAIATLPELPSGHHIVAPLRSMVALHKLPVQGNPGKTTSFFYTEGPLKGYVRGAWSPVEGLSAGLILLDPRLGSDKDFGDPAVTGKKFYTALLPWKRDVSRLDRFDPLMRSLKFRIANFR
jgi:hypothetical protein